MSLRQVAAGNSCIVLENYGYVEKHNPRSKVMPFEIPVPVSRYVTTEEASENIKGENPSLKMIVFILY